MKSKKLTANADGIISIADVVLFRKWLDSSSNTLLTNWRAADVYEDNKLDEADFELLKRKLVGLD